MKGSINRIAAIALMCALTLSLLGCGLTMNESESYAAEDVETLVNMMKAPDTFVLRGDVLHISVSPEGDNPGDYTFIDYSSANSYGTPLRGAAMFKDHKYIGDLNDDNEIDKGASDEEREEVIGRLDAAIVYYDWRLSGDTDQVKATRVDGKKIASNLDIEFKEIKD